MRQLDIDAGVQGADRRILDIVIHTVPADQFTDGEIITDDQAFIAPFIAQHIGQQPAIGVTGDAVNFVIGRHDLHGFSFFHHAFEGQEEVFPQFALGDLGRADIHAAFGLAMAGHVLECHEDAVCRERQVVTLETPHRGDAQFGDQIGVLAIRLLNPSPALVAGDIDDRSQRQMDAAQAHLARGDVEHVLEQFGVPGRGQADGLREAGRVRRDIAVQRLLVEEQRNAEAGFLDRPALRGIDVVHRFAFIAIERPGIGTGRLGAGLDTLSVVRAGDLSEAVGIVFGGPLGREIAGRGLDLGLVLPDADHLGDLFLERHAREQVFHPGLDRLAGVAVDRVRTGTVSLLRGTGGLACQDGKQGCRSGEPARRPDNIKGMRLDAHTGLLPVGRPYWRLPGLTV